LRGSSLVSGLTLSALGLSSLVRAIHMTHTHTHTCTYRQTDRHAHARARTHTRHLRLSPSSRNWPSSPSASHPWCVLFIDVTHTLIGLKVPCAPKYFSSSFSYSTCTNDFGAATHNERRFQFRLGQSRVPSSSGFHG